ncbi:hypothetical protein COW36_04335 [bacterium (Candidatus Blackallbacteria) CG17_big_fil_post_rev_8_21_14_2_50_48_46]|uniref:SMP-30/Gluconolactonase/LRE-like region domain-containing protein n=1 Tax=bacterium (Candidatus Blackallbacteria) CG17_big_fil_post_rev_8_21_14_2_50_48_46 TaxID=2014261 RepID=A0A2M7G8W3_9BACT|nr:MAG: hypothetical protein COW64_04610 [bacterium (Candidatus Blackallbacteria) CG18_big_fil_WC_8_21_14_2_50_49_26]PIW18527.1 MAG: hypothetical protein COW36_04335 [bacterium (Candidatus Blackallbacteria) CG17_big_fil_post_rev_8_21_14_2_50_48_46]PIW46488.1 MAG: hypothetical protein COW20_16345 [bacterium (Candidatus Blackallbacteria) CG13_big_fil_rev_8_21_14_2_50_49_14]
MLRKSFTFLLTVALWAGTSYATQAADNRVKLMQNLAAGPVAATWYKQRLLYAQQGLDQIMIWDKMQSNLLWSEKGCQPDALVSTRDNQFLVACQDELKLINVYGQETDSILKDSENRVLVGVQALVQDSRGGTYLAVSNVSEPSPAAARKGQIYYLSPSRSLLTPVASQLDYPQSLALSPDGKTLYVGEFLSRQIRQFDVNETQLSNGRVLKKINEIYTPSSAALEDPAPSAIAVNSKGQLYISLWGEGKILVTSSEGRLLGSISFPEAYLSSFTFGATERVLYATTVNSPDAGAAGKLYEIRL